MAPSRRMRVDDYFGKTRSRIVVARSNLVRNSRGGLDSYQIGRLLDNALEHLFEVERVEKIWRRLFRRDDVVGIKVNCLSGKRMSTNLELVEAIVEGLRRAGLRNSQIVIWDRLNQDLEKAGYKITTSGWRVRCYGNDQVGYEGKLFVFKSIGSLFSRILTRKCTAIINVPVLKDHGITGVTLGLKNFFGGIHNPNKYHLNCGDPYIADLNTHPFIRDKVRITICDALTAQYEGGPPFMPQWCWNFNGILVGTDVVALDQVGWQIIEKKRAEMGLKALKDVGREPNYIVTAADRDHRLGTNDPQRIEVVRI